MKTTMKALSLSCITALCACGGGAPVGSVHLSVNSSTLNSDARINSVFMKVLGVNNNWAGIQGAAYNSNPDGAETGQWSFELAEVPVGTVTVYAEALDSAGNVIFRVPNPLPEVQVTANVMASVMLVMQEVNAAAPFGNVAPFIHSLTTTAVNFDSTKTIKLAATVIHDVGNVAYQWTAKSGTFSAPTALQTEWNPAGNGTFDLVFTATDAENAAASLSLTVVVSDQYSKGGLTTVVGVNSYPSVVSISTSGAQASAGQPVSISAVAFDLDGDSLQFTFASTCGSFGAATVVSKYERSVVFTPAALGSCVVNLTVTDFANAELTSPRGGTNSGALTLEVGNTQAAVGPQFYVRYVSPVILYPGHKSELQVMPASTGSQPTWNYKWVATAKDGGADFGGVFTTPRPEDGFTDGSDIFYAPPDCGTKTGDQKISISVVVTDTATSAYNEKFLELTQRCPAAP